MPRPPKTRRVIIWIAWSKRGYYVAKSRKLALEYLQISDKRGPYLTQRYALVLQGRDDPIEKLGMPKLRLVSAND